MTGDAAGSSVSVVIPAHNAASTLWEQLTALEAQDSDVLDEVVVVDSCSTDSTANLVRRYGEQWPKVRLVVAERPGANVARNTGVAATHSDNILLCDADDVAEIGWIDALLGALEDLDVVRGRYDLQSLNDAATIAARGSVASTVPPEAGRAISGIGGNCGFRRSVWTALGGLLEHHYGSDDAEFFWRAHLAGFRVGYAHDAVVHYRLRPGYRTLYRQQKSWASGRALLYKEFRADGLIERRSTMRALKAWGWLAVHLPDAWSSDAGRRGQWVRTCANSVGNLRGSVRHRVFFP